MNVKLNFFLAVYFCTLLATESDKTNKTTTTNKVMLFKMQENVSSYIFKLILGS